MRFIRFISPSGPRWGRVEGTEVLELTAAPYGGGTESGQRQLLNGVKLLPPVEPSKVICIGRNYADHAAELGNQAPTEPMFFFKPPSSLIGSGEPIELPFPDHTIHWEAELAVVIGRKARQVPADRALQYVFGYTIANDVSDRDYQKADQPFGFGRGKAFDTFCPCGPELVTAGIDPLDTQITLTCNDQVRQFDSTALMLHNVPKLIDFLSRIMTLEPGDIILTGTPKGVGRMMPGDVIAISVAGIGTLSNPVR